MIENITVGIWGGDYSMWKHERSNKTAALGTMTRELQWADICES